MAVSGGSDSVGLLRCLIESGSSLSWRFHVGHLHHGTRGEEADADAAFVTSLAEQLGVPCTIGHWQPSRAGHFEADARSARLAWLESLARDQGANAIAMGHTLDDQAETVLHRIVRGTGLRGLAGIPAIRQTSTGSTLIRPLLSVRRLEIRGYLEALGQPYREDATNLDVGDQTRARLRLEIVPTLQERLNPQVVEALVRLGNQARSAETALRRRIEADLAQVTSDPESTIGVIAFDHHALRELDCSDYEVAELFRLAWRRRGWPERTMTARRWQRLVCWVRRDAPPLQVTATVRAHQADGRILLEQVPRTTPKAQRESTGVDPPFEAILDGRGAIEWPGVGTLEVRELNPGWDPRRDIEDRFVEVIDAEAIRSPLRLTGLRPGDRFRPLGMTVGAVRVVELLRRAEVPPSRRSGVPILRDSDGIVWVVGHRIADRARCVEGTRVRLEFRWSEAEPVQGLGMSSGDSSVEAEGRLGADDLGA